MRKGILAIAAAGSVFALTAAGAAGFNLTQPVSNHVTTSGAAVVDSDICKDAMNIEYTLNAGKTQIVSATVTNAVGAVGAGGNAACYAGSATLRVVDSAGSPFDSTARTGTATGGSGTETGWTFDFTGHEVPLISVTAPTTATLTIPTA